MPRPFHLALPVADLGPTRAFYTELLGCGTGREDTRWLDLDFFGHQVTLHLVDASEAEAGLTLPVPALTLQATV